METIEDIVREMRDRNEVRKVRLRQYGGVHCNCSIMPDDLPKEYANRIEKAYRSMVEGLNGGIVESDQYIAKLTNENERLKAALQPVLACNPSSFETHYFKGGEWATPVYDWKLCEAAVLETQRIYNEGEEK